MYKPHTGGSCGWLFAAIPPTYPLLLSEKQCHIVPRQSLQDLSQALQVLMEIEAVFIRRLPCAPCMNQSTLHNTMAPLPGLELPTLVHLFILSP